MFTGIVDHCGVIASSNHQANAMQLSITHQFQDLVLGESICVDGACLTVTSFDQSQFQCDLSAETIQKTIAKQYVQHDRVNLERAMRLSDRLGGHMVTGHVDTTLLVQSIESIDQYACITFVCDQPAQQALLVEKGAVCVNGTSLTINTVTSDAFSVMLIPHTLSATTLRYLQTGSRVNIEFDYLAKLVKKQVQHAY